MAGHDFEKEVVRDILNTEIVLPRIFKGLHNPIYLPTYGPDYQQVYLRLTYGSRDLLLSSLLAVRIITGMDRNAPEWAYITGMDIKINLFYANKFIILP